MSFYHVLFARKHGFNSRLTWYENLFASFIGGIASFVAKALKIKGNTIVWNQLVIDGNFPNTANWTSNITYKATLEIADNTATITAIDTLENFYDMSLRSITNAKVSVISGHKYLVSFDIQASKTLGMRFRIANGGSLNAVLFDATTTMTRFSKIVIADTTIENPVSINISTPSQITVGDWFKAKNFCLFDLTKMLGTTLADSIYSMEQNQAGSGVAYFRKLFPLDYYSFESGKLLNFGGTSNVSIKTVGKNKVFKIIEHANLESNGLISGLASTNYSLAVAEVVEGTTYTTWFDGMPSDTTNILAGYFTEEPFLGSVTYDGTRRLPYNRTFTAEINGYIVFRFAYGITKAQCEIGSATTDYEPYQSSLKQLPISTYFPTGMKSAGSVYDELIPSKAVKRVGSVDLGTLSWSYYSGGVPFFYTTISDVKGGTTNAVFSNGYVKSGGASDKYFSFNNQQLRIYDSSYTDVPTFTTSVSGQYLNYELATEVETAITENLNYTVYSGGTEELLPIDDISTSPFSANIDYPSGNEDVYFTIKESGVFE